MGYNRDNPQIQSSYRKEKLSEKWPYPINGVRKKSMAISPGNWAGAFKRLVDKENTGSKRSSRLM